jgi:hypothetical protein
MDTQLTIEKTVRETEITVKETDEAIKVILQV